MDHPEATPNPAPAGGDTDPGELVVVFDTQEESEGWVVQSLLKSAGIAALLTGLDAPQDVLPGVGGVVVRVNRDQAEQARQMIEDFRATGEDADSESDDEVSGESA